MITKEQSEVTEKQIDYIRKMIKPLDTSTMLGILSEFDVYNLPTMQRYQAMLLINKLKEITGKDDD